MQQKKSKRFQKVRPIYLPKYVYIQNWIDSTRWMIIISLYIYIERETIYIYNLKTVEICGHLGLRPFGDDSPNPVFRHILTIEFRHDLRSKIIQILWKLENVSSGNQRYQRWQWKFMKFLISIDHYDHYDHFPKENLHLYGISRCMIENMPEKYAPGSSWCHVTWLPSWPSGEGKVSSVKPDVNWNVVAVPVQTVGVNLCFAGWVTPHASVSSWFHMP